MASKLIIDLTDLANGEKTVKGFKFTRRAIIHEMDPSQEQSGRVDDAARIYEAIIDPLIPEIGDSHPNVAACRLAKIVCTAIEPDWLQLDLFYQTWSPNWQIITLGQEDISMESSVVQVETSKTWASGSPVSLTPVSYIYPQNAQNPQKLHDDSGDKNLLPNAVAYDSEIPVVPLFIPARVLTYRKRLSINEEDLETLNNSYQGHVNNANWTPISFTYGRATWLCTGITWRTTDRRNSYNIEVQFQFKFDTFDAEVVFKDPHSGKVPNDVFAQGNAYRRDPVQREADFDQLLADIRV